MDELETRLIKPNIETGLNDLQVISIQISIFLIVLYCFYFDYDM